MPRQSDDPEHPSTLPQAELNPLLNPTLGRNMGRWAEVYFKSPPDKRDEAVQQLVRELETETPQAGGEAPPQLRRPVPSTAKTSDSAIACDEAREVTCFWCGYINRPRYKYCGRCGEPLASLEAGWEEEHQPTRDISPPQDVPPPQRDLETADLRSSQPPPSVTTHNFPRARTQRTDRSSNSASSNSAPLNSASTNSASTNFASTNSAPMQSLLSAPAGRSFRPWYAAVLAVVVLALAYVSWRGTPTAQPKQPVTNNAQGATGTPTPAANATLPPAASAANSKPETAPLSAKPLPSNTTSVSEVPPNPTAPDAPSAGAVVSTTGKGSEELAQARDFLNGTNGKERNTSEAAQWLWKAVRKENADATVLLSDLYLRGDGVAKSCEQARVLLDAAALKGRKDAAEQLRNLPAFGCE